jgi:hypothetical protein
MADLTGKLSGLFSGKEVDKKSREFECNIGYEDARIFFEKIGIKIDELKLPNSNLNDRTTHYDICFRNLGIELYKDDKKMKVKIKGEYGLRVKNSYEKEGIKMPGDLSFISLEKYIKPFDLK